MSIPEDILPLLRCPVSGQPLRNAPPEVLEKVASKPNGQAVVAGLIREDGTLFYRIEDGIPVLLPGEGFLIER